MGTHHLLLVARGIDAVRPTPQVRSDVTVSLTRFYGLNDILVSAYTLRPSNLNLTNVYQSRSAAGEGTTLTILHTEFDFDVDEHNGTPLYIAVLGASATLTQYLMQVTVDTR